MSRQLANALEHALMQAPSKAGMRLRSQRELATMLDVDRTTVRRSFEMLIEKGVLVHEHGNGTFLRKIPQPLDAPDTGAEALQLSPADVLVDAPEHRAPPAEKIQLRIGVWGELMDPIHRLLREGMNAGMTESGHVLQPIPLTDFENNPRAVAKLADALQREPCDGHLVQTHHAEAYCQIMGARPPPTVYVWSGMQSRECEPLARMDLDEALERAVRLLAAEGHRRIGLVGLGLYPERAAAEQRRYERALADAGLVYRAAAHCTLDPDAARAVVRQLFMRDDPPDAIYVADDVLLRTLAPALRADGLIPGKNLGVITLSNRGQALPAGCAWSALEFNPFQFGRWIVNALLLEAQTAGTETSSFAQLATWRPGETHRCRRSDHVRHIARGSDD